MCKILVNNFIIKDILKKKNVVHRISVRTIVAMTVIPKIKAPEAKDL